MSKKWRFLLVSSWILFSRAYDVYCTSVFTPDLAQETNPLASWLGLKWTPILLLLAILSVYVFYAYFISVFKPTNLLPSQKGYSFREFATYLYLGHPDEWTAFLYKFPKDFRRMNTYFGNLLARFFIGGGIVTTIMWLLINYTNYYPTYHSPALIYAILVILMIGIFYQWNKSLYQQYLSSIA